MLQTLAASSSAGAQITINFINILYHFIVPGYLHISRSSKGFKTLKDQLPSCCSLIRNLVYLGISWYILRYPRLGVQHRSVPASALLVAMLLGFQDCWRGKEAGHFNGKNPTNQRWKTSK